jgi:hypothetical protein
MRLSPSLRSPHATVSVGRILRIWQTWPYAAANQRLAFVPYLVLTLPVGVLAGRRRRRPLMIGADLGRAALLAMVPLAAILDVLSLPLLATIAVAAGALTVVFDVCYLSVLPGLVSRERI